MGSNEGGAFRRMPKAAWAWEGLRRNEDYRQLWSRLRRDLPTPISLPSGAQIIREKHACPEAIAFGLLFPADPDRAASDAPVFWRPQVFCGTLRVRLTSLRERPRISASIREDFIVLSNLSTKRLLLDTASGERHVRLDGEDRWLQLRCAPPVPPDDEAIVGVRLHRVEHAERRLKSAADLLRMHHERRSNAGTQAVSAPQEKLGRALDAVDLRRAGRSLREVATALYGSDLVAEDWAAESRYLKDRTRRAIAKGEAFIGGGYRRYLLGPGI